MPRCSSCLREYFEHDAAGYVYSGAAFDSYARSSPSGQPGTRDAGIAAAANAITDSDLMALSMLSMRVTGYQALSITVIRGRRA